MSTILKALEKARQERERQLRQQQQILTGGLKQAPGKAPSTPAGSAPVSPPSSPSISTRFSQRILVFAIISFGLSFAVLGIAIYFVVRMEKQVKTRPVEKIIVEKVEIREPAQSVAPSTPPPTAPLIKTEINQRLLSSRDGLQNLNPTFIKEMNERVPPQNQGHLPVTTADKTQKSPEKQNVVPSPTASEAIISNIPVQPSIAKDTSPRAELTEKSSSVSPPPVESPSSPREVTPETLGLTIEGVFWDEKKPMAIINGSIVGEGDRVGGVDIVKIYKKSIQVKKGSVVYNVLF